MYKIIINTNQITVHNDQPVYDKTIPYEDKEKTLMETLAYLKHQGIVDVTIEDHTDDLSLINKLKGPTQRPIPYNR